MKKFKIVLVSVVALILCLLCVTGNTFSWFSRPKELSGKQLDLTSKKYFSSVLDNIEIKSYSSSDGVNYGTTEVKGFSEISGIASGNRRYFRTDIYNKGANAQSVSLYLDSVTFASNCDGFALGVNGPSKTYKTFFENNRNESATKDTMRVYFQPKGQTNWTGGNYYVCYGVTNDPRHYVNLSATPTSGTYYADIPSNATKLFFSVKKDGEEASWQRTQTFTDIVGDGLSPLNSRVYWITGIYDTNAYNNAQAGHQAVDGANIVSYHKTINVSKGSVFPAGLVVNQNYIGESITYSSSDKSVFTVNSNGDITGVGVGSATLTTKVTGESFDDTYSVTTTVNVFDTVVSATDVPIVTNVNVQPSVADTDGVVAPSVSVYWYIKNDSEKSAMTYNISNLYLTL